LIYFKRIFVRFLDKKKPRGLNEAFIKLKKMAGMEGFEPTTNRLTVYCATTAPHSNNLK
jgi:hypothetical protein